MVQTMDQRIELLARENDRRIVLLVLDGLGGLPRESGGPTELESARTPNMDRLVNEGVTFTQCHVTAASCAPSRASLFTGQYPHVTGILKNADNWTRSWVENLGEVGGFNDLQEFWVVLGLESDRPDFGHAVMVEDLLARP